MNLKFDLLISQEQHHENPKHWNMHAALKYNRTYVGAFHDRTVKIQMSTTDWNGMHGV